MVIHNTLLSPRGDRAAVRCGIPKPQEWNDIVVTVTGGVARCECNGEVLQEALKLPETGPIGLEADRGQMEYRHVQITKPKTTP